MKPNIAGAATCLLFATPWLLVGWSAVRGDQVNTIKNGSRRSTQRQVLGLTPVRDVGYTPKPLPSGKVFENKIQLQVKWDEILSGASRSQNVSFLTTRNIPKSIRYHRPENWVVFLSCLLIVILACFNAATIFVILYSSLLNSTLEFYVVSLCIADFLLGILVIPLRLATSSLGYTCWPSNVFRYFLTICQLNIVAAIAMTVIDRYRKILHPWVPQISKKTAFIILVAVWIISLLANLYLLLIIESPFQESENEIPLTLCTNIKFARIYITLKFVGLYLVPAAMAGVFYIKIVRYLWNRIVSVTQLHYQGRSQIQNKRVIVMNIFIYAMFSLCWLPYNLIELLAVWTPYWNNMESLRDSLLLLGCSYSWLRILVYVYSNRHFRDAVSRLFNNQPKPEFHVNGSLNSDESQIQNVPVAMISISPSTSFRVQDTLQPLAEETEEQLKQESEKDTTEIVAAETVQEETKVQKRVRITEPLKDHEVSTSVEEH